MKQEKLIQILCCIILGIGIIVTVVGVFYENGGLPYEVVNIWGDKVKMYGNGLYAHDTYFKAPIQRGSDGVNLFIGMTLFAVVIWLNQKKSIKYKVMRVSMVAYILYLAISLAFGVAYNSLFPLYLMYFSISLYTFILCMVTLDADEVGKKIKQGIPHRGIGIFLIFAGLSVFVWLIDIIGAVKTGRPPEIIGTYTTEITFLLDLGVIAPAAFIASYLILHKKNLGYLLSSILLIANAMIGLVVIGQSLMQMLAGIQLTAGVTIIYVVIFVVMSTFAIYYTYELLKRIGH